MMTDLSAAPTQSMPFDAAAFDARERWLRAALFMATFLLTWISTTPFVDLGDANWASGGSTEGNLAGQLSTLALTAVLALFIVQRQPQVLAKAVTPILVLTLAWFALSAVTSNHPDLVLRRTILAVLTIFQAAVFLLLAPSREEFARLLAICSLIVLALCFGGVLLVPHLSIHQFDDVFEPGLAGSWRGLFAHKNGAGGCMAVLIFIGLFVARVHSRWQGALIAGAAFVFLIGTRSKSPIQLLPIVLLVVWLAMRIRPAVAAVPLLLLVPAALLTLTMGSVLYEPIRDLLERGMSDPSFTGRDVIWHFAIDNAARRPWLGHGFQAFWGTSELVDAWNPQESWGYRASDAHSSFLNLAVMTGYAGLGLALGWILVQPLADLVRRPVDADPAVTDLFMQIWLFGLCLSCFESIYFSGGNPPWFMIAVAIIGLRYQNAFQLRR